MAMLAQARFCFVLVIGALLSGCEPPRELEDGQPLYDRFWQGVPRDAFGENLDEPTVRDVRRVLRLPVGCVASFDRDTGMLFVRAPAEDLQTVDRKVVHAEPDWEGPIQLRLTASLWLSPTAPPNPWDPPRALDAVLNGAKPLDRREVTAFLGVQAAVRGSETQPLPEDVSFDAFDEEIVRRWDFEARSSLTDDLGTIDLEFTYDLRMPKPGEPPLQLHARAQTQCLMHLGQPRAFEIGALRLEDQDWRLLLVLETTRINPLGQPEPELEEPSDET